MHKQPIAPILTILIYNCIIDTHWPQYAQKITVSISTIRGNGTDIGYDMDDDDLKSQWNWIELSGFICIILIWFDNIYGNCHTANCVCVFL